MRKARYLPFVIAAIISACAVYDQSLLGNGAQAGAGGAGPSGGSGANGGADDPGGSSSAGASAAAGGGGKAGGTASNGGSVGDGGSPDEPSAGAGSESGGTGGASLAGGGTGGVLSKAGSSSGGTAGAGASSGGAPAGGAGASSGGAPVGGAGSGGSAPLGDALVDNMQHTTATYANAPFAGTWSRVTSGDMVWVATDVPSMFHTRADSTTNMAFRLASGCPASGNCAATPSEVEAIIPLNNGAASDLSAYTGVSFYINRVANSGAVLRVAFDDGPSHLGSTSCSGSQADCGRESEYYVVPTTPYAVSSGAWTKYQMPFSSFDTACGYMCTRTNPLSVKEVYSVRFRIDRNSTTGPLTKIDLDIDDLYFYK